ARDLCELRRGAVEARASAREDRRRDAEQAVLRRGGPQRPGMDPRFLEESRPGSCGRGRRGARVRALRADRLMTVQPEEVVTAPGDARPVFRRILLKLSGESLMGPRDHGIDRATIDAIAEEIVDVNASGVETAIVVGAGNIYRGMAAAAEGMD